MKRTYIVTLEHNVSDSVRIAYLRLGTYDATSPAAARKKAADAHGFTDAETLIAVPERYWHEEIFVPDRPTLGLGL